MKPPTKPQRYTPAQVIDALLKQRGLITGAAQVLGCDPITVRRMVARYPAVAAALTEAREGMLDVAEQSLYKQIGAGEGWAVKYFLSTQGKSRGYVERRELSGPDGGPIETRSTVDLTRLSDADLAAAEALAAQVAGGRP